MNEAGFETNDMAIHQLATSHSGSMLTAAEFKSTVNVWSLLGSRHLTTFESILDFGGRRLIITNSGRSVIAAAYHGGVASYASRSGKQNWHRQDLKKLQRITSSVDSSRVYCGFDDQPCQILSGDNGQTTRTLRGVHAVWESPYGTLRLLEMRSLVLETLAEKRLWNIARETFGILCVAFAPGWCCVSESGGPLRCLNNRSGREIWRYAIQGEHISHLAYSEQQRCFVGIRDPYERGGACWLLRIEAETGAASEIADVGQGADFAFCKRGSRLLCADGVVIDTKSGEAVAQLPFPQ